MFCLPVHPLYGSPRQNIVKLLEEQEFPEFLQFMQYLLLSLRIACKPQQTGQIFRLPQGIFRFADSSLNPGLGSIGTSVPRQIQLSIIDIFNLALIQPVKKSRRTFHGASGSALQILAAHGRLHHKFRGTAAPVSITEGKHKHIYVLPLVPVLLPALTQGT